MFTQLLSQPPIPLNKARPQLQFGSEVEAVVMRGLAKQPADRFPDVVSFAQALRTALLAPPSSAAATTPEGAGLLARMKGLFRRD
jgi:serine/threonine-protein kinase